MRYGELVTIDQLDIDPFPIYARLRRDEPVSWVPVAHAHFVTRWADVQRVARDEAVFSAAVHDSPLSVAIGPNLLHSDGTYHAALRRPLTAGLRPSVIRARGEKIVDHLVTTLLEGLRERTHADLIADFAQELSVRTLLEVTGLPPVPTSTVVGWLDGLAAGASNYERDPIKTALAEQANAEVDTIVETELKRGPVPGSLLEALAATTANDTRVISSAEISSTVKLLIIGGMQEPRDLFGTAMNAYLSSESVRNAVLHEPDAITRLIEESLRWGSPVGTVTRKVMEPVTISGVSLEPGAIVAAVLASANRDERQWDHPDEFDIARASYQHLAFSAGVHSCVGATLARTEVRKALEALVPALHGLELSGPATFRGWEFRGPITLPVQWTHSTTAKRPRVNTDTAPAVRELEVIDRQQDTHDVATLTLTDPHRAPLPPWQPGAHIDLHLPTHTGTLIRQYSLCGDPTDPSRWRIAVQLDASGRGGSEWIHEQLTCGSRVTTTGPRNNFPLAEAPEYLLIAAGIGITPMLPMIRAISASDRPWRLLYIGRSLDSFAFRDELADYGEHVQLWSTSESGRPDLSTLSLPSAGGAVYACGPESLNDALITLSADGHGDWARVSLHIERFTPRKPVPRCPGEEHEFDVELLNSGVTVQVSRDQSVLSALEEIGVFIPSACREGICGSCEVRVLDGAVDHRDSLSAARTSPDEELMLVCVSRCAGEKLVLDL